MARKRFSRPERRELLRKASRIVLCIVPLLDGATPEELATAIDIVEDFVASFRRAVVSIEDVEDDA